jgi:hypothetical protein
MSRTLEAGIGAAVDKVIPKLWKQAKRRADVHDRVRPAALARFRVPPANEASLLEAAFACMKEAYLKASANNTLPANARQIMYAARPLVIAYLRDAGCERTCWRNSAYFTQRLLPDYVEAHPDETASWDVVYDARGHLVEPHTRDQIDLGTLDVRRYCRSWCTAPADEPLKLTRRYPTAGPLHRYRAVLFVEKEGFQPLFQHVRLAERFDMAIMSTKGMSVVAARQLVAALSEQGVPILVIRDFDKAGFSIVHTLGHDTRRHFFTVPPTVIDLGLRLVDVEALGLESEPVEYRGTADPRWNLRECGATEGECTFLVTEEGREQWAGQRVELNAMTSEQLIAWIEEKLEAHGVTKVVPDEATLADAYRRAAWLVPIQRELEAAARPDVAVPRDLAQRVTKLLTKNPHRSWDEAIWRLVTKQRDCAVWAGKPGEAP